MYAINPNAKPIAYLRNCLREERVIQLQGIEISRDTEEKNEIFF